MGSGTGDPNLVKTAAASRSQTRGTQMSLAVPLADRWSFRSPASKMALGLLRQSGVSRWRSGYRGSTGGTWAGTMTMVGGMIGLLATKDGVHREEKKGGREGSWLQDK